MKIALFSDIHGNLPALEAVLDDIEKHQPDERYCLGDLVNFAPWTNEVIDLIRANDIPVVIGNHDQGIGNHKDVFSFSFKSDQEREAGLKAIAYTNAQIRDNNREYLRKLPKNIRLYPNIEPPHIHILLTHASPENINLYIQEDHNEKDLLEIMDEYTADVMLMGHTHRPYHRLLFAEKNNEKVYKHAINVGSVGKPKDGDSRAAWCMLELTKNSSLYDPETIPVHIHRVAYDLKRTVNAIKQSRISDSYAEALLKA
jgi:putative phosphoesterase